MTIAPTTDRGSLPAWCRYYGDVPASLVYPDRSLYQTVRLTVERIPDAVACEFLGGTVSYRELGRRIERIADALAALGLRAGDRLLIVMPTSPQAVVAYYAANALGAVAALVHPLSAAAEIEGYARASGSRIALTLDALYPRLAPALDTGAIATLVLTRLADGLPLLTRAGFWLARGRRIPRVPPDGRVRWWAELMDEPHAKAPRPIRDPSTLGTILFSGGTTGMPKGIMLSDRNIISNGIQVARWVNMREGDRTLAVLPLFHGFGLSTLVNAPLMTGCRVILVPEFSARVVAQLIQGSRPNFIAGVPSLYDALSRRGALEGVDLSCIKAAFSGGDTLPLRVKEGFDRLLAEGGSRARLLEGYGLTENVTAAVVMPLHHERPGSTGVPLPDVLVSIREPESGSEMPIGEPGEICISGPAVMLGYLNDPAATAVALRRHEDGRTWLHTGDIGRRDADGWFCFLGRRKRMIKSSGYNVFPGEVEQVLCAHPDVAETYVMGVPDDSRGERVRAYVVPQPDAATGDLVARLTVHCAERLARWSCPREIVLRSRLPRNRVGKVDQRALLEGPAE
ncbi:MAG TPA: AMP-binding protein [Gemmatimonadales bacterium]|jgi:long-chain acyl-CoA synthetase|nr:AMP-binding protein [Gemmatimonadales bacterium]